MKVSHLRSSCQRLTAQVNRDGCVTSMILMILMILTILTILTLLRRRVTDVFG